jgi:hypothetical protein
MLDWLVTIQFPKGGFQGGRFFLDAAGCVGQDGYLAGHVEQEVWQYWDGEHWTIGKQIIPPKTVSAADEHQHQLTCVLFSKN